MTDLNKLAKEFHEAEMAYKCLGIMQIESDPIKRTKQYHRYEQARQKYYFAKASLDAAIKQDMQEHGEI